MKRKRHIVLLSHCILNVNTKVHGLAGYESAIKDLVCFLLDNEIAMIQLPCPEAEILGLRRWGHVKDQLDYPFFHDHCRSLLEPFVRQVRMYLDNEHRILGVIGIEGSPSCGVGKTCRSRLWQGDFLDKEETWLKVDNLNWSAEPGIFMQTFQVMLTERNISLPFLAVNEIEPTVSLSQLFEALSSSSPP